MNRVVMLWGGGRVKRMGESGGVEAGWGAGGLRKGIESIGMGLALGRRSWICVCVRVVLIFLPWPFGLTNDCSGIAKRRSVECMEVAAHTYYLHYYYYYQYRCGWRGSCCWYCCGNSKGC